MPCRALLIQPRGEHQSLNQFPLGLAYLASALEAAGHEVRCLDLQAPYGPRDWSDIARVVADFDPQFVGLTLTIDYIRQKYDLIARLKKEFDRPVIVGGPHSSALPEEALTFGADVVCHGEGERTIVDFARGVIGELELADIPGLIFRRNGDTIRTAAREPIADLDTIPLPAYHHFPVRQYAGKDDPQFNRLFWKMFTSRGCPFNCIYCVNRKVFDNRWRMRSAENIFDEIKFLHERFGVRYIAFQDDEPMINRRRIERLCDLLLDSKLEIKISARGRIDSLKADVIRKMRAAGFYFLAFGTESGDDETLRKINKKYRYRDIQRGLNELAEAGVKRINVSVLTGFPWENEKHWRNDLRFIRNVPKELEFSVGMAVVRPYPGTEIYERYRHQYVFTEWWLQKPDWELKTLPAHVFFHHWLPESYMVHREPFNFWRYPESHLKKLSRLAVKLEVRGLKSRYDRRRLPLLVGLCLLSRWLYLRWPALEKLLFSRLSRPDRIERLRRFFRGRKGEGVVF
jgi:anaerobic magnesium-protoporphyrin IX monomethyl ester cyclase